MTPITVPLNKLVNTDLNVRVSATSDESIEALADNILANGLLQQLVVIPQGKNFAVVAGARRLAALKLLAEGGSLPKTAKISCIETSEERAIEQSLSENYMREKMTPCDTYAAFAAIAGATDTELAKRFGLSVDTVRRTKRLGNLHPTIFNAYAAGEIQDNHAQAYAATADTDLQLRVYELLQDLPQYERHASAIRKHLGLGDRNLEQKLRFVTVEAYEAAGGVFERDLFNTHDEAAGRISDTALLDELYVKAVTAALNIPGATIAFERPVGKGGFVDHRLELRPEYGDLPNEMAERLAEIETLIEGELYADDDEFEALECEAEGIEANRPIVWPEGDKIAVPRFDYQGTLHFDVYRVEAPASEGGEDRQGEDARASDAGKEEGRPAFTTRATEEIQRIRQHLLVVGATETEIDHRDAYLFIQAIGQRHFPKGLTHIHRTNDTLTFTNAAWFVEQDFEAFQCLHEAEKQEVACDLLRSMITASPIGADTFPTQQFGETAERNARNYWTPDAEFFDLFKKQQLVDMLHAIDPEQAAMLVNMKVADAKARALKLVTQPDQIPGINDEVRARALAWVPDFLRFTPAPVADSIEQTSEVLEEA